ncbi:hypothetical protein [Algoriphagus sp. NG3]|uniref:hypothetical protein n=1 Tax=Algoriphagus sp. NG3 TaxID=3097546 RepID=UPI002A7EDCF8|nr:hypothetical protein [Algoriphagus sp. NG3]WPR77753.1 hypothetical protein SLW71_10395 [Algoriphagus sp. NG3]
MDKEYWIYEIKPACPTGGEPTGQAGMSKTTHSVMIINQATCLPGRDSLSDDRRAYDR